MIGQFASIDFVRKRDQLCERMQTQVGVRTNGEDKRTQCGALLFAERFVAGKNVVTRVRTGRIERISVSSHGELAVSFEET